MAALIMAGALITVNEKHYTKTGYYYDDDDNDDNDNDDDEF